MTKRVNFASHQRVDLADVKAESDFRNQDIRRIMRHVVLGENEKNYIVQGFSTEPENAGVSSKILIKMDMGGGKVGAFVGAESYGGPVVDFGQVAGGEDAEGNLDGSAQALVDFSGKPAGSYDVKIKFSFTEGTVDNRAFWNPTTDQEIIKSTNTRVLPQWEAAISGHVDPEWVLIATVAWNGVAVNWPDIIDKRNFALEGLPRETTNPALRFSHPDQEDATNYGVGDFNRDLDRGDPSINIAGIYRMLRAQARQIQDIKGPRGLDGRFDWYSRVYPPAGFPLAKPKTTKNLRSVDTVTYTVADGITENGDFNGASALSDCLEFIQNNGVHLPSRIRIVLKNRGSVSGLPIFTWNKNIVIDGKHIELIGRGNGYNVWPNTSEIDGGNDGQVVVAVAIAPGTLALHMTGNSGLYLENIVMLPNTMVTTNFISLDRSCAFNAKNVWLVHYPSGAAVVLRCPSERCYIDNCVFTGSVYIGGKTAPSSALHDPDTTWRGGIVRNSIFWSTLLKLRLYETLNDTMGNWLFANRLRFQNCEFVARSSALYSGNLYGMLDARGARNIVFDQCHVQYSGDEDGVRLGVINYWSTGMGITLDAPSWNIAFKECQFTLRDRAYHLGWVAGVGGVNGTEGTGWAIKSHPGLTPTSATMHIPRGILIDGCEFRCQLLPTHVVSSPDAGAIMFWDTSEAKIKNSRIVEWTAPIAGSTGDYVRLIFATATAAGWALGAGQHTYIDENYIGNWRYLGDGAAWGAGVLQCIVAGLLQFGQISRNHISAVDVWGTDIVDPAQYAAALAIVACSNLRVEDNQFILWRSKTDPFYHTAVVLYSTNSALFINRNNFFGCGGYNIFAYNSDVVVLRSQFNDNFFGVGDDETQFMGSIGLNCTTEGVHFHNNAWDYTGVPLRSMHVGNATYFSVMGNQKPSCKLWHKTLAGAPAPHALGYAVANTNDVAGYF